MNKCIYNKWLYLRANVYLLKKAALVQLAVVHRAPEDGFQQRVVIGTQLEVLVRITDVVDLSVQHRVSLFARA